MADTGSDPHAQCMPVSMLFESNPLSTSHANITPRAYTQMLDFFKDGGQAQVIGERLQKPIGAGTPTVLYANPVAEAPGLFVHKNGDTRDYAKEPTVPNDAELLSLASSKRGGMREFTGVTRPQRSVISQFVDLFIATVTPIQPHMWPSRVNDVAARKMFLPQAPPFPVFVRHNRFGMALVVGYVGITQNDLLMVTQSVPGDLIYLVKKVTPFGRVRGEPYSDSLYAVPAKMCWRMLLVPTVISFENDLVEVVDRNGNEYSTSWTRFRTDSTQPYHYARVALGMQYPFLMYDRLTTRLFLTEPDNENTMAGIRGSPVLALSKPDDEE